WRTQTFVLAIAGDVDEAVKTANTLLPERLAESVAPYLRYMPRLTPAQQAAAVNLGTFPRASEIGRDDPRVAQYAPPAGAGANVASRGGGLIPKGAPLGSPAARGSKGRESAADRPARGTARTPQQPAAPISRAAPPEPQPARESAAAPEGRTASAAPG